MNEPTIQRTGYPTEAADGTPHLTYYAHDVSFVWSGNIERPIQVCPGGYGEPVIDVIWPESNDRLREPWPAPLDWFRGTCDMWLARRRHQARQALSDTHLAAGRSEQ